jgi:hypothetical protein
VLYVYAITESPLLPALPGARGASLRVLGDGTVFAVFTEHPDLPLEPSVEDLWEHEAVVEELMQLGTILPMRVGSTVPHERDLEAILRERRAEFESALTRVGGAVELGVRAQLPAPAAAQPAPGPADGRPGPGTAYMLARLERERGASRLEARIDEPLARLARASVTRPSTGPAAFNAAYLVDRGDVEDFRRRVEALAAELEDASIVCTGPWPPFSFSSGDAE